MLVKKPWFGMFNFDSSELPIVTLYAFYIPIFIVFMVKAKDVNPVKRIIFCTLATAGSVFMVFAAIYAHGYLPMKTAAADGNFSCPVLFYLIVFAAFMIVGAFFMKKKVPAAEAEKDISAEDAAEIPAADL